MALTAEEVLEVEKFLNGEYRYLHVIGLTYAPWNKSNVVKSILQYIVYYSVIGLMIALFMYTAYLSLSDIAIFSQSLHMAIVGVVAWTITITGIFMRNEFLAVHRILMSEFCEYEKGEFVEGLKKEHAREKTIMIVFWPCYYAMCAVIAAIIAPMLDNYLGVGPGIRSKDGISYKLPFALWTPTDIDSSLGLYVLWSFIIGLYCIFCALVVSSGVVVAVFIKQRLCLQLRLLIYSLNQWDNRARESYENQFGINSKIEQLKQDDCYKECLRQNVLHHQNIISMFKKYEHMASVPMFVPLLGGAVLLAMACIHLLSDDSRVGAKITSFVLILGEILCLFTLCVYGEQLKQLGEDIRENVYSLKWYNRDEGIKQCISIMHNGSLIPLAFKAGYLLELNMQTFATIMNSAYSYFNLVFAFNNK